MRTIENLSPAARLVRSNFMRLYRLPLTDEQLNEIDLTYFSIRKESIYDLGIYRGINVALSGFVVLLSIFFPQFCVYLMALFCLYNLVHLVKTIRAYKRLTRRTFDPEAKRRPADVIQQGGGTDEPRGGGN